MPAQVKVARVEHHIVSSSLHTISGGHTLPRRTARCLRPEVPELGGKPRDLIATEDGRTAVER
jgi:hypothetical protein